MVNVILVDFRGYDTFGEITVLGIAAVGVLALMDGMRARRPAVDGGGPCLDLCRPAADAARGRALLLPLALVVALYIFMRGHNQPGGGFIAGLITAVALVLQYMAIGQSRAEALLRARWRQPLRALDRHGPGHRRADRHGRLRAGPAVPDQRPRPSLLPLLGELPLATAALFDLGVYITVVGATLLTLSSLGAVSRETAAAEPSTPASGVRHESRIPAGQRHRRASPPPAFT